MRSISMLGIIIVASGLSAAAANAQTTPGGTISATKKGGTVWGRAWMGTTPWGMANVVVTNENVSGIYGECVTQTIMGSTSSNPAGSFSVPGLPANKKIELFIFSDKAPGFLGWKELALGTNEKRKIEITVNPNSYSEPSSWLIVRIPFLAKASLDKKATARIVEQLKSLRAQRKYIQ